MDDMNAFERQVAGEVLRRAGPVRPVDDLAVFNTMATAMESSKWRFRSTSTPSANGHTPTVIGRTQSMFSPVKAIAAGAIVFALGGVMFIAQPFERQGSVPGAETSDTDLEPPVEFTGVIVCGPEVRTGTTDIPIYGGDTALMRERGWAWQPSATISEPRLEGTYYYASDGDEYRTKGATSVPSVGSGTWRIENDEGAWQGSHPIISFADGTYSKATTILIGEGAYEGLTAIWEEQADGAACAWEVRGLIIGGDVPAAPEAASSD